MSDETGELQHAKDSDLLWGTQAIADYIERSLSQTQYLIRIGALPVGRLGPKTIFASKKQIGRRLTPTPASQKDN